MKKTILTFVVLLTTVSVFAQNISDNAIGIRFGDNNGFGGEISYQRKLNDSNRLEVDLGIRGNKNYSGFKATGLYQWVFALPDLDENVNWFVGVGGGVGSWKIKEQIINNVTIQGSSSTFLFGAGVIGIEYTFDIPLQISLDFRPEIGFNNVYDGFNSDLGLGIRYLF